MYQCYYVPRTVKLSHCIEYVTTNMSMPSWSVVELTIYSVNYSRGNSIVAQCIISSAVTHIILSRYC